MQVLSSLSSIPFYAPSAGFAPTNSADVSAIASAYQVVSATATQLYAGTAYVTSVNDNPLSASRAGQAANASMANSAYYDGTGRLISALPDEATVSAIASAYADSAASGKLDKTAQVVTAIGTGWNSDDDEIVSAVNGCILSADEARYAGAADWSNYARYDRRTNVPGYRSISSLPGSAEVSAIASSYAESAASSKQDTLTFGYDTADKISSINGSSLAGEGGGLVTALGTGTDPWYQNSVSSINNMNLSAKWADSASNAATAGAAMSATFAQTADYTKTVAPSAVSAYISAVTSRSGTIIVTNRTGIDATDSAVVGEYVPGYSGISTYANTLVPFNGARSAIFTGIPDSLPVTLSLAMYYGSPDTITFSGSNGTTASASYAGSPTALTADLGKVSSVYVYTQNQYIEQDGLTYTADAVDNASIVPLAHASALPTYQYDAEDKISSINGSAIAGGMDSATCSAIASAYAESAASSKLDTTAFNSGDFYSTSNPSGFIDSAYVDSAVSGKADSSALSSYALSADVSGTVDLVSSQSANWGGSALALSAGNGVTLSKSGDTLAVSTETVLWSGTPVTVANATAGLPLAESPYNFDRVALYWVPWNYTVNSLEKQEAVAEAKITSAIPRIGSVTEWNAEASNTMFIFVLNAYFDSSKFYTQAIKYFSIGDWSVNVNGNDSYITKIVGINRTAEA